MGHPGFMLASEGAPPAVSGIDCEIEKARANGPNPNLQVTKLNIARPGKRLLNPLTIPSWLIVGKEIADYFHLGAWIVERWSWFATDGGRLLILGFALVWLFAVALWPPSWWPIRHNQVEVPMAPPKPSTTLKDSDPRIEIEFHDDIHKVPRIGFIEGSIYFTFVNRGMNSANLVCLSPIRLRQHWVRFPQHSDSLNTSRSERSYAKIALADGATTRDDLFDALNIEYKSFNDAKLHDLAVELIATYQDDAKNLFETRCKLVFNPSGYADRTELAKAGTVVYIRDQAHKKIAERIY
jgi:hypothetical protein